MKGTRWNMQPNKAKAMMLAKRQVAEFVCDAVNLEGIHYTLPEIQTNQLMLTFYDTGEQQPMNSFLRSCLDGKIIEIMKEEQIDGQAAHNH
ncbi:MAG: hypothetical protein D3923_00325 [Candidatus Electrothrix sp. AR3]|nr:hypothetical protein [Candidatus Electrothrix sp. AR3]